MHGKVKTRPKTADRTIKKGSKTRPTVKAAGCSSDPAGSRLSALGPVVEASPTRKVCCEGHCRKPQYPSSLLNRGGKPKNLGGWAFQTRPLGSLPTSTL